MNLVKMILTVAVALGVSTSFAQQKKQPLLKKVNDQVSGQGYGMAGCGLGSIVLGDQPGIVQIFAATTNGTSGSQTFGITTGTSNCGTTPLWARVDQFIDTNKTALENDMSRGQGETLASLSQVMECKNSSFNSNVKASYSALKAQSQQVSQEQLKNISIAACNI